MNSIKLISALFLVVLSITSIMGMEDKKLLSLKEFSIKKKALLAKKKNTGQYKSTAKSHSKNKVIRRSIAELALQTDMTNQKKLKNIRGDEQWQIRKKIITIMIEEENQHPDVIKYLNYTPLEESIQYDDLPFATYLLQKNAQTVRTSISKKASLDMSFLLQKYTIIT